MFKTFVDGFDTRIKVISPLINRLIIDAVLDLYIQGQLMRTFIMT